MPFPRRIKRIETLTLISIYPGSFWCADIPNATYKGAGMSRDKWRLIMKLENRVLVEHCHFCKGETFKPNPLCARQYMHDRELYHYYVKNIWN